MEGKNNQNQSGSEGQTVQEEAMNRVNQTFDKISQDVKNMINDNNQNSNLQ
jgi:hypothetical protein